MTCNSCKKRDRCKILCSHMEKYIAISEVSRDELPVSDEILEPIFEQYLEERIAPYIDRHTPFLPELEKRLGRLTESQRTIIELYYYEGLSLPEIAERLKLDPSGVRKRFRRILEFLRQPQSGPLNNMEDSAPIVENNTEIWGEPDESRAQSGSHAPMSRFSRISRGTRR